MSATAAFLANKVLVDKLTAGAVSAAKQAGCLMTECVTRRRTGADSGPAVETKACAADFVTEVDKKCDVLIMERLTAVSVASGLKEVRFMTEESLPDEPLEDAPTWVVDPIDGTTSFMHQSLDCCVSIALTIERRPVIGVVFAPLLNELFVAVKGRGATYNGEPLITERPHKATKITEALVGFHLPARRTDATLDASLGIVRELLVSACHSVRCYGSAALDCCAVAVGRMDLYFELGISAWDVAAGILILQESGCCCADVTQNDAPELKVGKLGIVAASSPELVRVAQELAVKHGMTPEKGYLTK